MVPRFNQRWPVHRIRILWVLVLRSFEQPLRPTWLYLRIRNLLRLVSHWLCFGPE